MKRKAPKPIILTTGESISVADKSRASGATISQPGRSMASVPLEQRILTIRGHKVVLDADLSALYGVPTERLNEQFRRNRDRFPEDFAFQLSSEEWADLRSQIAASSSHGGRRYAPIAFTEHGALMAANILNSTQAITMSVYLIRAFVKVRETLVANVTVMKRLAEIDKTLLTHDAALRDIYRKLRPLLAPPPVPAKPEIGFHTGHKNIP